MKWWMCSTNSMPCSLPGFLSHSWHHPCMCVCVCVCLCLSVSVCRFVYLCALVCVRLSVGEVLVRAACLDMCSCKITTRCRTKKDKERRPTLLPFQMAMGQNPVPLREHPDPKTVLTHRSLESCAGLWEMTTSVIQQKGPPKDQF